MVFLRTYATVRCRRYDMDRNPSGRVWIRSEIKQLGCYRSQLGAKRYCPSRRLEKVNTKKSVVRESTMRGEIGECFRSKEMAVVL